MVFAIIAMMMIQDLGRHRVGTSAHQKDGAARIAITFAEVLAGVVSKAAGISVHQKVGVALTAILCAAQTLTTEPKAVGKSVAQKVGVVLIALIFAEQSKISEFFHSPRVIDRTFAYHLEVC